MTQYGNAALGQLNTSHRPFKQTRIKLLLKCRYVAAQCGLTAVRCARSGRERAMFANSNKGLQECPIEVCHQSIHSYLDDYMHILRISYPISTGHKGVVNMI
nr:hypothetical protein [Parasphingopyxis sp. CP4]